MVTKSKKRKILVIDPFSNGHEAAKVFIKNQNWKEYDCEIVFCGSHKKIFEQLIETPDSYAVIPIRNSTTHVGEITEVTNILSTLREKGHKIKESHRIDLPVIHCILVSPKIKKIKELTKVISHEKALAQCSVYLKSIGMTPNKMILSKSTSEAAREVVELGPNTKVGAISNESAAEGYGLKILIKGIQDERENKTTFLLIQNKI